MPRALYLRADADLRTDLIFTFANRSQDWGEDVDLGNIPVLLDAWAPRWRQYRRVLGLMLNILNGRYTVAHLAGWGHWVILLAILCCKARGVPFSLESDTQLNREPSGWKNWVKARILPTFFSWPAAVLPGGSRQAELFRHYGVSEQKISVTHMSVDTRKLRQIVAHSRTQIRAIRAMARGRTLALFVGRLVKDKGIEVLLKAFESAAEECEPLNLVIIGDGPLRGRVEEAARSFAGRIHYLGRQSQLGVARWMRACDFLVLPSHHEPWGLVVNEAMACGRPVIVSDACGCSEDLVRHQRSGYIFPSGDADSLSAYLRLLAGNSRVRHRMSVEARRIIKPWVIERQAETIRLALVKMSYLKRGIQPNPFAMHKSPSTNSSFVSGYAELTTASKVSTKLEDR